MIQNTVSSADTEANELSANGQSESQVPARPKSPRAKWLGGASLLLLAGLICGYYFWTVRSCTPDGSDFNTPLLNYNYLTDALAAGQLYLLQDPPRELVMLRNPYDPRQNTKNCSDLSLYKGRYFIYFGLTPVLLFFGPLRILGFGHVAQNLGAATFFCVAFLASLAFLRALTRACKLRPGLWLQLMAVLALGLGNAVPYLLRRPAIYETAVGAGFCCQMLSFYFLATGGWLNSHNAWRLLLGGIFAGLAIGARPTHILFVPFLVLLSAQIYFQSRKSDQAASAMRAIGALWLGFCQVMFVLSLYNYFRFGSLTEIGAKYQVNAIPLETRKHFFDLASLGPGLYFYLWQGARLDAVFPFFHAAAGPLFSRFDLALHSYPFSMPAWYNGPEPIIGLFSLAPILFILLAFPILWGKRRPTSNVGVDTVLPGSLKIGVGFLLAYGILQLVFLSVAVPGACMRYTLDFSPMLLLAALIVWFALDLKLLKLPRLRWAIRILLCALVLYGCVVNLAIGMTGDDNYMLKYNAKEYALIKHAVCGLLGLP